MTLYRDTDRLGHTAIYSFTHVFKRVGGGEEIDGRNIYFSFSYFF